ncbi:MAG TPA: DUF4340 domain-containing protein [Candidatus Binatia bacterium]|nr:DUF4340 domain-containing protein [Candidatus Binatia bacterium]
MRWRQVIVLYAVLAALGAAYWSLAPRSRRAGDEGPPARARFLPVDAGGFAAIRVVRGGRTIRARRVAEDRWEVTEPADAAIPSDLVAAFAGALADAEEIQRVAGAGADPEAFGLGEAAAHVEIELADGKTLGLAIGETNANGTAVYARRDPGSDVVLIGRNARYYEDLLFQALPGGRVPAGAGELPVGG